MARPVKVAAVQAEPGWLDLQASVDKTISLIADAGRNDVNVLGYVASVSPHIEIWYISLYLTTFAYISINF